MRYLDRLQPFVLFVLRVVLGVILIAHGYPKVFGGGFQHHMEFVGKIGLPHWMAYFSTGAEFFGGIGILIGLFTRCFSIAVLIEMLVIIFKVELHHGLKGGYELPMAIGTMAFVLIFFGAGPISLDGVRSGGGRGKTK